MLRVDTTTASQLTTHFRVLSAIGVALTVPGCGTTVPQELVPQSVSPVATTDGGSQEAPELVADAPPPEADPELVRRPSPHPSEKVDPESEADPTTIWIGARSEGQSDLSARLERASRDERRRREQATPPIAIIDDENLAEYAKDVKVTFSESKETSPEGEAALENLAQSRQQEEYWRSEALRLRLAWRDAYDEIPVLEEEAAGLRRDFYAADDPFYRDQEIKPAWDRVLDRIEEAKDDIERYQEELSDLIENGRRAGALPGWLREGIELEPVEEEPTEAGELDEARPGEPPILQQTIPP